MLRGLARDVARPVAEEGAEGHRVAHGQQGGADEGGPEAFLAEVHGACVGGVEGAGEGEEAQQEHDAGGPYGDLVHQQHEAEAVDAHRQDQDGEQAVGQAQGQVGFRQFEQALGATDQGVAGAPDGEREERDGGEQGEEGTHDTTVHAEVRTRGHRVVGAVDGAEHAHGGEDQRTHQHAQQDGPYARLEGQAEEHREAAEHGGCEGVGAAEDQAEQVQRAGIPFVVGNLLDAVGFYSGDCVVIVVVIQFSLSREPHQVCGSCSGIADKCS
ncbi:hypothetical protein D9M68_585150 [compost metagenome]